MTQPVPLTLISDDLDAIASAEGCVAVFVDAEGRLDKYGRRVKKLSRGQLDRLSESKKFKDGAEGDTFALALPHGMSAEILCVVKLSKNPDADAARRAGGGIAAVSQGKSVLVLVGNHRAATDIMQGLSLRNYDFRDHKKPENTADIAVQHQIMVSDIPSVAVSAETVDAISEGVFFTRDLVNAPANILTTQAFADKLSALEKLGVEVEVLDEPALKVLGMGALLGVGQGSPEPSKVVIMRWNGGGAEAPLALVGKGVVFDTGGISIKPAGGMEQMTMDMGGAGVVAGVMRAIAARHAKANVVGVVGLVENMPDGLAQRPGDVVTSMKGDTIEVINTDAEGRLVLADILWYTQERFKPSGMINLATLTGAIIVGLGHENAGVFSNNDALCHAFLKAAADEGEGAWRMPMGKAYDKQLKSRIADMKNVGGRPGGASIAAQFLARFVKEETPWIHLDIAGVALLDKASDLAPAGATGWGVRALNRLIAETCEGSKDG